MKNKLNISVIVFFALIFISVFYRWFFQGEIIGGDWPYLFKESLENYYFLVPSWNTWQGNGLGGTNPIYFLQSFEYLTVFLANFLHIPWPIIYKVFWFGFFIFLSVSSSIYFISTILGRIAIWQKLLAAIIFTTNTYVLMLVGGGQMGVALSYAVTPFILGTFIKIVNLINSSNLNFKFKISNFKFPIVAGLALSLQVLFDPRLAYITMIAVAIYMALDIKRNILSTLFLLFYTFAIPGLITLLMHFFWILPLFTFSQNMCERFCEAYTGVGIVNFLSFSTFSQSLSLLHPNWPENIFGKVGFMKPEFLAMPLFAYLSLFFVGKNKINMKILYVALLGIVGAFLAKGANPPFGEIYLWLFENVPGFVLFRDPTKFYLLTALSYSVLIPFSIYCIYNWLISNLKLQTGNVHLKFKIYNVSLLFTICYLLFLIHPAILGQLGGTFKKHEVPKEYVGLKDFLYKQPDFFRTLWVPRQHRFTFLSNLHPSVEAGALFNATSSSEVIRNLKEEDAQKYLSELAIKYIIVPYDSMGEIFQKDRKYDEKAYGNTVKEVGNIKWLKQVNGFGKIKVFQVPSPKKHFYLESDGKISSKMISPTNYLVDISISKDQNLIFSEKYNSSWVATTKNKTIKAEKTPNNLNGFALGKGDYDLEIIFLQDKVYSYTRVISLIAFLGALFFEFKYRKR